MAGPDTDAPGPERPRRRRPAAAVLIVVALLVVVAVGWFLARGLRSSSSTAAGSCQAAPGATLRDIDEDDDPEHAWAHVPGQKVTVYFQTRGLPPRYVTLVERAADIWSRGGCISAVGVDTCPAGANCTTVVSRERSRDKNTDGESTGTDRSGVRVANKITYFTGLLDRSSDNGALATVVHEMGHALGLVHRLDKNDVMNADTNDRTDPVPDEIDFANLVVIYGGGGE